MPESNHHSPRVNALLGRPPGWLLRWGTAVVFVVISLLLIGAATMRYPEVIAAPVSLSGTNPPQALLAQKQGRFAHFFAPDNSTVQKGQWLALLESEAQYNHVQILDSLLQVFTFADAKDRMRPQIIWPNLTLGQIQAAYKGFTAAYLDQQQLLRQKAYPKRITALETQLFNFMLFYQRSWQQRQALQAQYNLAAQRYQTDSALSAKGVYAAQDLMIRKEALLQLEQSLHAARGALAQAQMRKAEMEQNLAEIELEYEREKATKALALQAAHGALKNALQLWLKNNVFLSQVNGKVSYQTFWAKGQNINQGQLAFTVLPTEKNTVKAQMLVPPNRFAMVHIGQRVQIKLAAYPFEQYGFLVGEISKRNTTPIPLPEGQYAYLVETSFPDALKTSYGMPVQGIDELTGKGEIVTEDLSVLERIFYSLRKVLGKR